MSFVSIPAFCLLCVLAFSPVSWAETYKNLEQYESADGKTFTRKGIFVERADTPSCIEYWSGEILCAFQWFPLNNPKAFGKIALMLSRDDGENWTPPQLTEIAGMPGNLQHVSEPALVALQDGRLRLYFTAQRASAG
ncbi:MAG: exo-alpha-sialidase, partial [Candidatus Omnitrophica bacterium]|nr:exo-alpha-sialidase [Candidatus Omnitrophota bacterium]